MKKAKRKKPAKAKTRVKRTRYLVYSYCESACQVLVDVVAAKTYEQAIAFVQRRRKKLGVAVDGADNLDDTVRHLQDLQKMTLKDIDQFWRGVKRKPWR